MKNRKYILLLATTLLTIFAIVACGKKDAQDATSSNQAEASSNEVISGDDLTENPLYKDMLACMDAINDVRAGSAGTAERAVSAAAVVDGYIADYGLKDVKDTFTDAASIWFSNNEISAEDFNDNLTAVLDELETSSDSEAYSNVIEGIKAAVK